MATQFTVDGANAALDGGLRSALAGGKMVLKAGATVIATLTLENPAFAAPASGGMALAGVPLSTTAAATGTIDAAEFRKADDTVLFTTGASTGAGADKVVLTSASATAGQTVQVTSYSVAFPYA